MRKRNEFTSQASLGVGVDSLAKKRFGLLWRDTVAPQRPPMKPSLFLHDALSGRNAQDKIYGTLGAKMRRKHRKKKHETKISIVGSNSRAE